MRIEQMSTSANTETRRGEFRFGNNGSMAGDNQKERQDMELERNGEVG